MSILYKYLFRWELKTVALAYRLSSLVSIYPLKISLKATSAICFFILFSNNFYSFTTLFIKSTKFPIFIFLHIDFSFSKNFSFLFVAEVSPLVLRWEIRKSALKKRVHGFLNNRRFTSAVDLKQALQVMIRIKTILSLNSLREKNKKLKFLPSIYLPSICSILIISIVHNLDMTSQKK